MNSKRNAEAEFFACTEEIKKTLIGRGHDPLNVEWRVNEGPLYFFCLNPFVTVAEEIDYLDLLFKVDADAAHAIWTRCEPITGVGAP